MDIKFTFSNQYEAAIAHKPVPFERGDDAVKTISSLWEKCKNEVMEALFDTTDLIFTEDKITCYANSHASFSDPLSLKIEDDGRTMLDNLIHELIHVLLTQNYPLIEDKIKKFHDTYKSEVFTTRIHILVHAIHLLVAQKLFPDRVNDIHKYSSQKEYRDSWAYVDHLGAQSIVDSVFKNSQ